MSEEGGYLGAMTYQAIYSSAFEKLRSAHSENQDALSALNVSKILIFVLFNDSCFFSYFKEIF